jgi:hypothetical protein
MAYSKLWVSVLDDLKGGNSESLLVLLVPRLALVWL